MAKLVTIESGFYRIPLPTVLTDSTHGQMRAFELNTVRLKDSDGAEGVGYTFTVGRNGGAIDAVLTREMPELFVGEEADEIERLWRKAWWALHYGGRGGPTVLALSAFDMALWDLKARRARLPLWNFLGGFDPKVPCYAGGIDLDLPLDKLLRQTDDNLAKGFRAIKMKVGRERLAQEGGRPIAAGENLRNLWEFKHYISCGGVTFPEPDVTNCGGVTSFMKIAHLAEDFNLPVTSHGAHDVTVHLLAAAPNRSYLEAHGFGLDKYIAEPLEIKDGFAIAPSRAGHGITFDWKGLDSIRAESIA